MPGYIMDQQVFLKGVENTIGARLWYYIQKNTIDFVIIRGKSASKKSYGINNRHQESVGYGTQIQYISNPDVAITSSSSSLPLTCKNILIGPPLGVLKDGYPTQFF